MLKRIVTAVVAAVLALAASAPAVSAQKALVYCPVGIDASGCDRIVTALQSTFTDGVDRGYDGSNGTVDLSKIDLHHYGVFVVPSLADDATKQPYAQLHSVASRLHFAITGRVAVYSGAPDQGSTNRSDKDALIQNLATWAANGHSRATGLVGLVAFLDLSEHASDRYSWVRDISLTDVSADAQLTAFGDVQPVSARGTSVLSAGGRSVRFSNMASYGLHIGRRAAARTEVGALGGSSGAQSVLVMYSNADGKDGATTGGSAGTGQVGTTGASLDVRGAKATLSSGTTTGSTLSSGSTSAPTITTDKPDYQPGDTVTFTGTGFAAGDTVTITVHEDPTWSYPDRQFVSVTDANGSFKNTQMVVATQDLGVTFTATAVGNPSGLVAQTTFTDGNATSVSGTVTDASNSAPLAGVTVTCTTIGGCNGTITTTTDASGHYVFDNTTTKLTFGGNGPTALTLTFAKTGYVTGSLTISSISNGNSFISQDVALTPAGPTKLVFTTSPVSGAVNACLGPITVQTQNASSTPTNVISNTTVSLVTDNGGSGAAAFYDTNTCSSTVTNLLISTGSNSGSFYYKASARGSGSHQLTASGSGLTSANQTETIDRADQATLSATEPTAGTYGDHLTMTATGGSGTGELGFAVVAGSTACSIITTQPDSGRLAITAGSGSCSFTATKAQDNDYNGQTSAPLIVTVGKKTLTVATLAASNKVYDATTAATLTGGTLSGVLAGDEANVGLDVSSAAATFDNKNVGNGKTVTATGLVLNGSAASNYVLNPTTATTTANITPLTITGAITASNKVYDGGTSATIATRTVTGVLGSDVVTLTGGTATFADKNVATGKTVTATGLILAGADAGNYSLAAGAITTHADITARTLVVTASGQNKIYDGTTAATVTLADDRVAGDVFTDSYTAANFSDKSVGTGKTVNVTGISISGTDAGNYTANTTTSTTADITALAITGHVTANNKVYDGASSATIATRTLTGQIGGDNVSYVGGTATFADKNVGTGKTVTATGLSLSGSDAGNYTVNTSATTTANITSRVLAVSATGVNKVYDGTTAATVTLSDDRVSGDALTTGYSSATFASKNVGTAIAVSVSGISVTGTDAGNYTFNTTASTTANITPRPITVKVADQSINWTGSTITPTYSLSLVSGSTATGETLTDLGAPTYSPTSVVNVGTYTVTVSGLNNPNYAITANSGTLTIVDATAPLGTITQLNPAAVNTQAALQVNINDVNTGNSNVIAWKYSIDGAYVSPIAVSAGPNATLAANLGPFSQTDVKTVCIQGEDAGGNWSLETCGLLAIYDPSGGFVTGGGWITAADGSCDPTFAPAGVCTNATGGRANFGFVSKYQKGANVPSGNTEFQFQAGNLNFKSATYQWLVISGPQAQFKGVGTINGGSAQYSFILTAVDGAVSGGGGTDKCRIKIMDSNSNVIFDNMLGAGDSATPTTALGGGDITIHSK